MSGQSYCFFARSQIPSWTNEKSSQGISEFLTFCAMHITNSSLIVDLLDVFEFLEGYSQPDKPNSMNRFRSEEEEQIINRFLIEPGNQLHSRIQAVLDNILLDSKDSAFFTETFLSSQMRFTEQSLSNLLSKNLKVVECFRSCIEEIIQCIRANLTTQTE